MTLILVFKINLKLVFNELINERCPIAVSISISKCGTG
jgi:hypothetical protein